MAERMRAAPATIEASASREFLREAFIDRKSIDEENRTADVSFSSQEAVQDRFFGPPTVLLHEVRSVDLKVIRAIGAALLNHDPSIDSIAGRIASAEIDEKTRRGVATIQFDDDDIGNRAFAKVKSGSLRGVSVRFSIGRAQVVGAKEEWQSPGGQRFKGGERGLEIATQWTPREISLTPIPADTSVGVGREDSEDRSMNEKILERLKARGLKAENFASEAAAIATLDALDKADLERATAPPAAPPTPPGVPPARELEGDDEEERREELDKARRAADRRAAARLRDFTQLEKILGEPGAAQKWLDESRSVEDVRKEVIEKLEKRSPTPHHEPLEYGLETIDKAREVCLGAICRRNRIDWKPEKLREDDIPSGMRLIDIGRCLLVARGEQFSGYERPLVIMQRALSHTSGDFPALLSNVAQKSMQRGFEKAETTYQIWTTPGTTSDFKIASRPAIGEIQDFVEVPDGMPLPESMISENGENVQLRTYARKFVLGRQAWLNDDQRAFTRMPQLFGAAGRRTINKATYDHLVQAAGVGPTMAEDGIALFADTHPSGDNYLVGGGTTLATAGIIGQARSLMRRQKSLTASKESGAVDPSSAFMNISGRFLLVPSALEYTADQIVNGVYFPTTAATAQIGTERNLVVVVEPLLDDATNGATAWYLIADPDQIDTVEVTRLEGQEAPEFMILDTGDALGFAWAGFVDFGVKALQHRGMVRSKGAA